MLTRIVSAGCRASANTPPGFDGNAPWPAPYAGAPLPEGARRDLAGAQPQPDDDVGSHWPGAGGVLPRYSTLTAFHPICTYGITLSALASLREVTRYPPPCMKIAVAVKPSGAPLPASASQVTAKALTDTAAAWAKAKPLATKTPADYGVDVTPRLTVLKTVEPAGRKAGVKVASVAELIAKLKDEAGVI